MAQTKYDIGDFLHYVPIFWNTISELTGLLPSWDDRQAWPARDRIQMSDPATALFTYGEGDQKVNVLVTVPLKAEESPDKGDFSSQRDHITHDTRARYLDPDAHPARGENPCKILVVFGKGHGTMHLYQDERDPAGKALKLGGDIAAPGAASMSTDDDSFAAEVANFIPPSLKQDIGRSPGPKDPPRPQ